VHKAGRSGSHLKRLYALIPPLPVQRSLNGAGPPANPTSDLDYLVGAGSIYRKLVAAMWALVSYVVNVHASCLTCGESICRIAQDTTA